MIDASDFRSVLDPSMGVHQNHHNPYSMHHHHAAAAHHVHQSSAAHLGAHHPHTVSHQPTHHQQMSSGFGVPGQGSYPGLGSLQPLPPISTMSEKFTHHPYHGHTHPGAHHAALMQHMHQSAAMQMNALDQSSGHHHSLEAQPADQYMQHLQRNQVLSQHHSQYSDSAKNLANLASMSCIATPPTSVGVAAASNRHVASAVAALISGNSGPQSVITSVSSAAAAARNPQDLQICTLQSPDRGSLNSPCTGYDFSATSLAREMSSAMQSPPTSPSTVRSVINLHSPTSHLMGVNSLENRVQPPLIGNGGQVEGVDNHSPSLQSRHLVNNCNSPSPPPGHLTTLTVSQTYLISFSFHHPGFHSYRIKFNTSNIIQIKHHSSRISSVHSMP